uniref:Uncharacterized protein n=1 Tax=Anguilla anguilla TaxID=7936 RepID=A0A0E9SCN4_ANGAN
MCSCARTTHALEMLLTMLNQRRHLLCD